MCGSQNNGNYQRNFIKDFKWLLKRYKSINILKNKEIIKKGMYIHNYYSLQKQDRSKFIFMIFLLFKDVNDSSCNWNKIKINFLCKDEEHWNRSEKHIGELKNKEKRNQEIIKLVQSIKELDIFDKFNKRVESKLSDLIDNFENFFEINFKCLNNFN